MALLSLPKIPSGLKQNILLSLYIIAYLSLSEDDNDYDDDCNDDDDDLDHDVLPRSVIFPFLMLFFFLWL